MKSTLFNSEEIAKWNSMLNSEGNIPEKAYRRDVPIYSLVCYVNNIISCYLSKNVKAILIFAERARLHLKNEPARDEWIAYYAKVEKYLDLIEEHFKDYNINTFN